MKSQKIKLGIGLLISAVFLVITFKGVDFKELWNTFKTINYFWYAVFLAATYMTMVVRCFRWQIILEPTIKLSYKQVFSPLMIGFGLNGILPFRAGEFARAYVIQKKYNKSFVSIFATVVVERIFDMISIIILFSAILWMVDFDPDLSIPYKLGNKEFFITADALKAGARFMAIAFFVAIFGIILLIFHNTRRFMIDMFHKVFFFLPEAIRHFIDKMIEKFATGFDSLKSLKKIILVSIYSMMVWLLAGFSLQAMGFGFQDLKISFLQGNAITVIICLAIALPSVPGYWGLYEAGCLFAVVLLGISGLENKSTILGYSLAIHFGQMLISIGIGLFYFFREGLSLHEVSASKEAQEEDKAD